MIAFLRAMTGSRLATDTSSSNFVVHLALNSANPLAPHFKKAHARFIMADMKQRKIFSTACFILLLTMLLSSRSYAEASQLLGTYWFPEKDGQLEIILSGAEFQGKVTAYDIPDQTDDLNPDPALKGQIFLGSLMLKGFHYNERKNRWEGGTIYDASEGKNYKSRMWFDGDDTSVLNVRGYIGSPMFGRTTVFERVK